MKSKSEQLVGGVRIGLFGLLGSGNIGNDASLEAVLGYLRARHPLAVIDVMCSGPESVTADYGLDAVQMFWFDRHQDRLSSKPWNLLRVPSRVLDVFRVSSWVRRHEVVIVPGAGVLEATPPAATVEHTVRALPPHRVGKVVQDEGRPGRASERVRSRSGRHEPSPTGQPDWPRTAPTAMTPPVRRCAAAASSPGIRSSPTWPSPCPPRGRTGMMGVTGRPSASASWRTPDRTTTASSPGRLPGVRRWHDGVRVPVGRRCPQGASVHRGHRRV